MKIEDVMGIHVIFVGILTVIHLYVGKTEWTAIIILVSVFLVYGVYIPLKIIFVTIGWTIRKRSESSD